MKLNFNVLRYRYDKTVKKNKRMVNTFLESVSRVKGKEIGLGRGMQRTLKLIVIFFKVYF